MSLFYTPWNSIPGKPDFKTINGQSIFGSGDIGIDLSGQVPYTGATQDLNLGIRNLKALSVYIGGSSGPKLTNNAGTIELKTNDDSAFAPLKADRLTVANPSGLGPSPYFSSVNSLSEATMELRNSSGDGYTSLNLNSLTATGTVTSPIYYVSNGGPRLDNSSGTIRARTNNGLADAPFSASNGTFSGPITAGGQVFLSNDTRLVRFAAAQIGLQVFNGTTWQYGMKVDARASNPSVTVDGVINLPTPTTAPTVTSGVSLYGAGSSDLWVKSAYGSGYWQIGGGGTNIIAGVGTMRIGGTGGLYITRNPAGDNTAIFAKVVDANTLGLRTSADTADASLNCANVTSSGTVTVGGSGIVQTSTGVDMYLRAGTSTLIGQVNGGAQSCFRGGPNQFNVIALGVGSYVSAPTGYIWSNSAGLINLGTTVSNTSADLRLNNIRAVQPTFFPGSSVTPDVTNGALTIEATSNTQLTFKLRGSDGTVRTGTLTLS